MSATFKPLQMLVTGGGGFLGLYIVELLRMQGHAVRVLCRGHYPAVAATGAQLIQGDIRDASLVQRACDGVDAVFHTAAIPGIWGPRSLYFSINHQGTLNVLNACRTHAVARLIYTSSPSVVFDASDHLNADESTPYPQRWLCHYPHSKALAEQAVLAASGTHGLLTCALRPHLIWGPRDNHLIPKLLLAARHGRLRQVGNGQNLVSVSYVENAAAAHLAAEVALRTTGKPAGRAYFINDPTPVNLWDWINLLLNRAGLPPVQRKISARAAWNTGAALEVLWTLLRLRSEPPMTRFLAAQLAGSHAYNTAAAIRDFDYSPGVGMEEGLRRLQPDLDRLATATESHKKPAARTAGRGIPEFE
ncbi:MAG: NAD-dependent epimerase/dehydratase family protein [Planctomycetota bacterium]